MKVKFPPVTYLSSRRGLAPSPNLVVAYSLTAAVIAGAG